MTERTFRPMRAVVPALAFGAVLLGSTGVASANHGSPVDALMCGTTITASTTLTHDVGPCAGDGLIMGADNITLDLGGFTVYGVPGPQPLPSGAGIVIQDHSGVTVKNGRVSGFDGGVEITRGGSNTVSQLDIVDNVGSAASTWGEGIGLWRSATNQLLNNTVARNGIYAGIALYNEGDISNGSSNNTIRGNTVQDNNAFQSTSNQNIGIRVEHGSKNNVIEANNVTGSGLDGIALFQNSNYNSVTSNTVTGNGFHLMTHRKGDGIRLWAGAVGNTVSGNTATGNTAVTATGTAAVDLVDLNPVVPVPCGSNTWSGNTYGSKNPSCIS